MTAPDPRENHATVRDYIEQQVIPPLAKCLGKTAPATFTTSSPENAFYISDLIFADIQFAGDAAATSVVIKRWPGVQLDQNMFLTAFHNEILFYCQYARHCPNKVPKCYYALESGERSFLVLENVSSLGYSLSAKSHDLDMDYVVVSIKEIAKFHSAGYTMKYKDPDKFENIVREIQETKFNDKNQPFKIYVDTLAPRAIKYLRSIHYYDSDFCDKMEHVLQNAFDNLIEGMRPVEPLATICHGDFLRNNVLYKQSETALEAMLIDFATIRYSTPAVDLATFIHLSCRRLDVLHKFDDIFALYCDTLRDCLLENNVPIDDFDSSSLLDDYKRNAIVGYIIASFFLPIVIHGCLQDSSIEDVFTKSAKEYATKSMDIGGDEMTKLLADMLLDLRERGCLNRFLS